MKSVEADKEVEGGGGVLLENSLEHHLGNSCGKLSWETLSGILLGSSLVKILWGIRLETFLGNDLAKHIDEFYCYTNPGKLSLKTLSEHYPGT